MASPGPLLLDPSPALRPEPVTLTGRRVTLTPLDPRHSEALYKRTHGEQREQLWRYLPNGPFPGEAAFRSVMEQRSASRDPLYLSIIENATGECTGWASFLRIEPAHRSIEVGSILFTPELQRTPAATEAMYLMARHAFEDLGYRRYEWKCDALNAPSRRAALRLGFRPEGIFRQHMIIKGRNRDTAWFAMLDGEWPARKANFERWLAPENFDHSGEQKLSLSALNQAG
ncbi:MAG TPA: GNAT family protein [Acidobacteriaceae bacterium]|nr:GNAT family protein [Acidobacteriaceae bacterium]